MCFSQAEQLGLKWTTSVVEQSGQDILAVAGRDILTFSHVKIRF